MREVDHLTVTGKRAVRAVARGTMSLGLASSHLTSLVAAAEQGGYSDDPGIQSWVYRPALRLYEYEHGDWTEEQVRATFAAWVRR